jgi:hypothetical protein
MANLKFRMPGHRHSQLEIRHPKFSSRLGLRLAETRDAVAVFPLAALLEEFGALKTLEDIALAAQSGRRAEAAML